MKGYIILFEMDDGLHKLMHILRQMTIKEKLFNNI